MKEWLVTHKIKSLYDNGNGLTEHLSVLIKRRLLKTGGANHPNNHEDAFIIPEKKVSCVSDA
jgi:hypothetical protein